MSKRRASVRTSSNCDERGPSVSRRGALVLIAVFFVLSLVKVSRHEIWSDEAEYWDAARASHSLAELRANTRYMGQPPLNHLVLYGLSRFTRDPRAMQVLNVVEATGAVAVVAFCAPWSPLACALFAFGYFPFFEYGTISRHYALMLLLALGMCAAWRRRRELSPAVGGLGFLLAVTTFHGTILVLALWLAFVASALVTRRRPSRRELVGATLLAAGVALSVATSIPPPDSAFLKPWTPAWDGEKATLAALQPWQALAPLPTLQPPWWNRTLLDDWPVVEAALGGLLVALVLRAVRRSPLAVLWLAASLVGLLLFTYQQWGGAARHAGVLFVACLAALWIGAERSRFVTLLLALQVPGGVVMSGRDLMEPFSPSVATAEYLRAKGLADLPAVGAVEFAVAPVFVLLDRPFYSPQSRRWRTRPEYRAGQFDLSPREVLSAAQRLQAKTGQPVVLVLTKHASRRTKLLACFDDRFFPQRICVYRLAEEPS